MHREVAIVSIVFILAVLMPISVGLVRRFARDSTRPASPAADPLMNARMDRLEQAMDAIAIEIERISEGQRFVTKVLTERPAQSAAAPSAPKPAERQAIRQSITPH